MSGLGTFRDALILLHGSGGFNAMIRERLRKKGGVSFEARAIGPDGRFYTETFRLKRDAQRWLIEQAAKKNKGEYIYTPNKTTVDEYYNYYVDTVCASKSPGTIRDYRCNIKNHISPLFGKKRIVNITYDDGLLLQNTLKGRGLSNRTNEKIVTFFKQVLRFATSGKGERRVLDRNPLEGLPYLPISKKEMDYWEQEEVIYFLDGIDGDHYAEFYEIALNTGMRLGEIAGLQAKKIDFKRNIMTVSNALTPKEGGGHLLGPTKGKVTRYLPMNDTAHIILKNRASGKRPNDYLFTDERGKLIQVYHLCHRKFKPLQRKLGMSKVIRIHDLRHTYASNYMMSGGDIFSLQRLLGHTDIKDTQKYAHLSPRYMQDASKVLDFRRGKCPTVAAMSISP